MEVLAELRQVLVENPRLAGLREAIKGLPTIWQGLTESDPMLKDLPGAKHLSDLQRWIEEGVFSFSSYSLPKMFALPVTVLLQIAQYVRYLHQLRGGEEQSQVLKGLKNGGIQGFCIGFLTAITIACSETEEDIAALGAINLRLAFCVGAYVDHDGSFAKPPNETACIAVRWRGGELEHEDLVASIQSYPDVSKTSLVAEVTGE